MSSIAILLALSALSGFLLGVSRFSWWAIMAAGAVLAPVCAIMLQNLGFSALSGISIIVVCLAINQVAYVVGRSVPNDGPEDGLPHQRADDEPHDGREDDIRRQHKHQKNSRLKQAQLTNQRQADLMP
jgi:hypothetical protein